MSADYLHEVEVDPATQTRIDVPPQHRPHAPRCLWCGEPAVVEKTIVKARHNVDRLITKRAVTAPVCQRHAEMVERNEEVQALRRRRKIHLRNVDHPTDEQKAIEARATVRAIETRLRELGEPVEAP